MTKKSVPEGRMTGQKGGLSVTDGLANVVSGMGGRGDKRTFNRWTLGMGFLGVDIIDEAQIEAAYRTSGIVRKVHDLLPEDMTKKWRKWNATRADIAKLEAEERRLKVREKYKEAARLARLRGGAAIVLGMTGNLDQPAPKAITPGDLTHLHVFPRGRIRFDKIHTDINSPDYGTPVTFIINKVDGTQQTVHPSRVIVFKGSPTGGGSTYVNQQDEFWGLPLMQSLNEALQNFTVAQNGVASLIPEMKADVIRVPGLTDLVSTAAGEAALMARLGVLQTGRSQFNTTLLDGGDGSEGSGEEWETRQLTLSGLPEIMMTYAHFVAAWLDVPVTKLMNSPPKGMNATGEYDDKNYASSVNARQVTELKPRMEVLDTYLFQSAGVKQTLDTTWEFVPLQEVSTKEASEIELNEAKALKEIAASGLVPVDALSKALVNRMEESGRWPGIAEAVEASTEEIPAMHANDPSSDTPSDNSPRSVSVAGNGSTQRMSVRRPDPGSMQDAAPRTLYVSRKVMNPQEILRWARENNLPDLQKASDLHVTVAYSRSPVDWLKMPSDWSGDDMGRLRVPPGGARLLERLGDGSAVVLSFSNDQLAWRNKAFQEAGCSWDWPDYVPHITLSWNVPSDFDLSAIKPYQGRIVLSPERFEEIV